MMKTLILEPMPPLFGRLVEEAGYTQWFEDFPVNEKVEVLIVRTRTLVNSRKMDQFPALRMILRAGSGVDNIDLIEARKREIIVCHTPQANAPAAAEHAITLILNMIKQIKPFNQAVLEERTKQSLDRNREFSSTKILIVGCGHVGRRVAAALSTLGFQIKGVDPYLGHDQWQETGIERIPYRDGLAWCDLVSFHCPGTPVTMGYYSSVCQTIPQRPVWIVNTARGGIVDERDLIEGLRTGRVQGAALDVFEHEPDISIHLQRHPRVLLTPHCGAYTEEAHQRLSVEAFRVWESFAIKGELIDEADPRFPSGRFPKNSA